MQKLIYIINLFFREILNNITSGKGNGGDIDLLEEIFSGDLNPLNALESFSEGEYVIFLEPFSLDDRIVNQFALFSMMSIQERKLDD